MKVFSFFKKLIIFIICFVVFVIAASFVYVNAYAHIDQEAQSSILNGYSVIQNNFYSDNETNSEVVNKMNEFIASLSPNIGKVFNQDWKFVVADVMPSSLKRYVTNQMADDSDDIQEENLIISGYSNWHTRVVYVKTYYNTEKMYSVFVHELGHCFDYEFGSLSCTDEFQRIYSLYQDTFVEQNSFTTADYVTSSKAEFFATLFKEYFLFPDVLKQQAPEAYDFIDAAYKTVSVNDSADTTLKYDLQSAIIKFKDGFKSLQDNK